MATLGRQTFDGRALNLFRLEAWPAFAAPAVGEHGTPRIDSSQHVWFSNDQLAVRFIEEIDFDYAAQDATSALLTAAS